MASLRLSADPTLRHLICCWVTSEWSSLTIQAQISPWVSGFFPTQRDAFWGLSKALDYLGKQRWAPAWDRDLGTQLVTALVEVAVGLEPVKALGVLIGRIFRKNSPHLENRQKRGFMRFDYHTQAFSNKPT